MPWDSLQPYLGPLLALAVSLLLALLLRGRGLAGLALALGAFAGLWWVLGGLSASPRQIPERLPLLAAGAVVLALPLCLMGRAWLGAVLAVLGGLLTGWWMAGAPMVMADLRRVLPVLLVLALLVPLLHREATGPWRVLAAALALLGGVWAAGAPGPWFILALLLLAAALPLPLLGRPLPEPARLGAAMILAGVLAAPVLARGAPADWAGAAAPVALLLLAPMLAAGRGGWREAAAGVAAAGLPIALARWLAGA